MVLRRKQGTILAGRMFVLNLRRNGRSVRFAGERLFLRSRARSHAAFSAVEGNMGIVIDDDRPVNVDVGDVDGVYVHHGCVVKESSAAPFTAAEADATISESVINAAIKSDVRSPISSIPGVDTVVPSPISGGPQHADGCDHPGAGHPVVTVIVAPCPVARSPQIARAGADRLIVNRQCGRTDANRNADPDADLSDGWRRKRGWNNQQQKSESE